MVNGPQLRTGNRRARSLLFAPATHERRIQRLDDFGADVIVIDLEDAVAEAEKMAARGLVAPALASYRSAALRAVRVNGLGTGLFHDDVAAVVGPDLDAIVVPKIESLAVLRMADSWISTVETRHGLPPGGIAMIPIVETARGVAQLETLIDHGVARMPFLVFGSGDFTSELGIEVSEGVGETAPELLYVRSRIVIVSKSAGLAPPIDGPYLQIHDAEGLLADTRRSKRMGFQGRVIVYPKQVAIAHDGYSRVTDSDIERSERIVAAFEAAEREGSASIQVDGLFVDYPIYRRALETLASQRSDSQHMDSGTSGDRS